MTDPAAPLSDVDLAEFVGQAKPFGCIYMVTHRDSGRFYVGQTRYSASHRWNVHKSAARTRANTYFYKAIRAHGPEATRAKLSAAAQKANKVRWRKS